MCHARTCTGTHKYPQHAAVCRSVKFCMLHLRDCPGTDLGGRPCKLSWCRPGKRMLDHLSHCSEGTACLVCNPAHLCPSLAQLRHVNEQRGIVCEPCGGLGEDDDGGDGVDAIAESAFHHHSSLSSPSSYGMGL